MSRLEALPARLTLQEPDVRFRDEFRAWLAEHVPTKPEPTERKAKYEFGRAWQKTLAEHGWSGVTWPKEFGGMGAGPVQQYLYYEELTRAGAPDFPNRPGLILLAPTLMAHADEEIQQRYLPGMLTSGEVWAQGFSEPGAGSDLAALRTTARLEGGSYRVDGQKTWVTAGDLATHGAILCRTGDVSQRHRTLTLLLIELDQPGVDIRPIRSATGGTEFCEIFFDGAVTPANHAVGGLNGGWKAAMTLLEHERGDLTFTDHRQFLTRIASIWSALDEVDSSAAQTRVTQLRERLGFAWMRAHQLREMNVSQMLRRANGTPLGFWGSPVKAFWGELNQLVQEIALDATDLTPGLDVPELGAYMHSRMSTVYSGAIDIQRSVVAERLLGLPRATGDRPTTAARTTGESS